MQHSEIVGVGGQDVRQPVLRPDLGRQHRTRVDSACPGPQQPARSAEHRAELALRDGRDLADPLQLVFIEPEPDVVRNVGKHRHRVRRQEGSLVSTAHQKRPARVELPISPLGMAVQPSDPGGCLRDQLVHRDADRERQPEPLSRLAPDSLRHIHRRTEEPLGPAQVEKGVTEAPGLDDRSVDPEDLVQRP